MNNKLLNLKTVGIPLVVVLIVILGIIFILTRNSEVKTPENLTSDVLTIEDANVTLLPVESLTQVKLANSVITFNESYFVNTVAQAKNVSGITCGTEENDSCIINFLTDGTVTYYISTPFEPIADDGLVKEAVAKAFEAQSGTIYLKSKVIEVVNEAGEKLDSESLTAQMYGCIKDNICVGSGILDVADKTINSAQVTKFENFVKSLNIQ